MKCRTFIPEGKRCTSKQSWVKHKTLAPANCIESVCTNTGAAAEGAAAVLVCAALHWVFFHHTHDHRCSSWRSFCRCMPLPQAKQSSTHSGMQLTCHHFCVNAGVAAGGAVAGVCCCHLPSKPSAYTVAFTQFTCHHVMLEHRCSS